MNEQAFEKLLDTLSCNGCSFFINEKCTQQNAEKNESDKSTLVKDSIKEGTEFSIEWAKNINSHFVCDGFNEIKP